MTTLNDTLGALTVNTLKQLLSHFPGSLRVGRKELLVDALLQELSGPRLRATWERLDACQRLAVAETVHLTGGVYAGGRFRAKYGESPAFHAPVAGKARFYEKGPDTMLWLFLYEVDQRTAIPDDLRAELAAFVPTPAPNVLATLDALPATCADQPLTVRHTEADALLDLPVMLRTVDHGQIAVSDKTAQPSGAALRMLSAKLSAGDFYPPAPQPKQAGIQQIGPIKAFAWPLLMQASGLAQRNGSKLALSPAGVKAMGAAPAATLRAIWQKWMKSTLIDEFNRIDDIKGQKSKGQVMAPIPPRRAAVAKALQQCPAGTWISTDEFSRFMEAEGMRFEVCHNPWPLYIGEPKYGSLGMDGGSDWNMLQFRYALCLLFEYCATLGMIDVAYVDPEAARDDFGDLWGADELMFLSRYDGLMYFRITALGAYCLGMRSDYAPAARAPGARLSVQSSLQVTVVDGELAPDESLMLDTWAVCEDGRTWRLSRENAIAAIERGHDIAQLESFLQAHDAQPLPVQVEGFIRTCGKQGRALKVVAASLLIECVDAGTADLIAAHKETAPLCLRAGARHLVVRSSQEAKFRNLVRVLGYGMEI